MDPDRHRKIIGVELAPILEHIRQIDAHPVPIVIRIPIVPGFTADPENLAAAARFACSLKNLELLDLLPYHRMAEPKYKHLGKPYSLSSLQPPSAQDMEAAKSIFTAAGLKAVIAGKD
jgi:pyruvate formate lyase activating enzyme